MLMPTGLGHASFLLILDWSLRVQMIAQSSCGTLPKEVWSKALMITKVSLTRWDSILMEHVLLVEAVTDQSKFGTLEAKGYFSTTMHIKMESTQWPSILTGDICCQLPMTRQSRYGTWDKDISFTLSMVMKAHRQVLTFHLAETTSVQQVLTLLSWYGRATWMRTTKNWLRI